MTTKPTRAVMKARLWIRSSRGTNDHKTICFYRKKVIEEYGTIRDYVENKLINWCEEHGCWHMSESFVRYGWYIIRELRREK